MSMNRVMRLSDHQADRYWRVETLGGGPYDELG